MLSSVSDLAIYIKNFKHSSKDMRKWMIIYILKNSSRHVLLFIVSLYNVLFIPLQMGFQMKFEGIYLFMEIFTILLYITDAILIIRSLRRLLKQGVRVLGENHISYLKS